MMRYAITLLFCLMVSPAHAVQVQEVVSKRGIKAWLVQESSVPLISVKIVFKGAGYAYDTAPYAGRANMAAAMLTEGAGDLSSREFSEVIESHAIALEAGVDEDHFSVVMESLSEHADKAFMLTGMAMADTRLDDEAMARTRRQIASIIKQQKQNPGYKLWRGWREKAYAGHRYSQEPSGTEQSVADMSRVSLRDYYQRYITQQNMLIAVVGDITPEALKRLLNKHFAALPMQYQPDHAVPDISIAAFDSPIIIDHAIPQTMVMFGLPGITRHDPDFFNAYVLNHVIAGGGSLTSRLGKEMRIKKGLTYGVGAFLDLSDHSPVWRGSFSTRNAQAAEAISTLKTTLKNIAQRGVTEEELSDAKTYITGSFVLGLDSNADIANYLMSMQLQDLGIDYLDRRNALVEAVTLQDVNRVAASLLDVDALRIGMIGQPELEGSAP